MIKYLRVFFDPLFWLLSKPYSKTLDEHIISSIKNGNIKIESSCRARIGGVDIWIENYPYFYGTVSDHGNLGRPSIKTIIQLPEILLKHKLKGV